MLIDDAGIFVAATVIATFVAAVAGPLVRPLIERWVSYKFEERLEALRYKNRVREQAGKVAEFLALSWNLPNDAPPDHYRRVNRLSWELALYLRPQTYVHLKDAATGAEGRNPFSALMAVRSDLLGEEAGELTEEDIFYMWPNAGRAVPGLLRRIDPA